MNPDMRKQALRQITYGLYVVGSMADDVVGQIPPTGYLRPLSVLPW